MANLLQEIKERVIKFGKKVGEDYKELIPKLPQNQPLKDRFLESVKLSLEPYKRGFEGLAEGATGGLVDIPSQKTSNIFKKIPYGAGYLTGFALTGKALKSFRPVQFVANPIIAAGLKVAKGGKIAGLLGRGLVNVGEGIPYTIAPTLSRLVKASPKEAIKEAGRSTAFDIAIGATPVIGTFAVSTPMPKMTRGVIKSLDDLASATFKEFKGRVGEEVGIETKDLFEGLIKKGYSISKELLDKLEKTPPSKYLPFKSGLAYKEGGKIFFGFDEEFKPKAIESLKQLKVKPKEVKTAKEALPALEAPPQPPLLTGKVKLTPKQSIKIFKKTGKAIEPITEIPPKKPIVLPETVEQLSGEMGKASFAPPELIETKKDLDKFNSLFSQPRRVIEDLGKKAKEFTVDFLTRSLGRGFNFQKEIYEKVKPLLDDAGVKPDNKNDQLLFDYIEGKVDDAFILKELPDKLDAFKRAKEEIRVLYDDLLERINAARVRMGEEEIKRREDYVTHLVEMGGLADRLFGGGLKDKFYEIYTKSSVPFFRFGVERKGSTQYKKSITEALDNYFIAAIFQIYLPEAIERFHLLSALAKDRGLPSYSKYVEKIANYLQKGLSQVQMVEKNEPLVGDVRALIEEASRRVSANLVSHNLSASLSNFSQIATTLPTQVSPKAYINGWIKTVLSPLTEENNFMVDGFQSLFLRLRKTPPRLHEKAIEKFLNKTNVFRIATSFTDNIAFRSFYEDALLKGMSPEEAIKYADDMASKLVGERVMGLTPAYIRDASLYVKPLTLFTLETTNIFYSIFRDNLKMSEGNAIRWATRFGLYTVLAELFNQVTERTIGRRFAFSPIDITLRSIDAVSDPSLTEQEKLDKVRQIAIKNIPLADVFLGKGRYGAPILAPVPTQQELEENPALALAKFGLVGLNPYGGGYQIYKTLEGLKAYQQGAVETPKGEVKYPVEKDFENFLKLALFGKSSVPEAREFYEKGRKPLTLKQSVLLKSQDKKRKDIYEKMMLERAIKGEIQSMKNDINEKFLQGKLTKEYVIERQEKAKKAIEHHIKQYKSPKGLLARVLEYLGLIAKTEAEEKGITIPLRESTPNKIKLSGIGYAGNKTIVGARKLKIPKPPEIKIKPLKIKSSKKKTAAPPTLKISPPPKRKLNIKL